MSMAVCVAKLELSTVECSSHHGLVCPLLVQLNEIRLELLVVWVKLQGRPHVRNGYGPAGLGVRARVGVPPSEGSGIGARCGLHRIRSRPRQLKPQIAL